LVKTENQVKVQSSFALVCPTEKNITNGFTTKNYKLTILLYKDTMFVSTEYLC